MRSGMLIANFRVGGSTVRVWPRDAHGTFGQPTIVGSLAKRTLLENARLLKAHEEEEKEEPTEGKR